MAVEAGSPGEAEIDRELLPIIHAEIDRLPDRYRAPIALCCLQGLSYEQASHQLGLPLGTVGSRITRARELLRSRLVRRGVTATTAALSVLLAREATAAPAGWVEAATRAAMRLGAGEGAAKAAGSVSAAVALSDHVLRRMLMIRLIQMIARPGRRRDGRPGGLGVGGCRGAAGWPRCARGCRPKTAPIPQRAMRRTKLRARGRSAAASWPRMAVRSAMRRSMSAGYAPSGSSTRSPGPAPTADSSSPRLMSHASGPRGRSRVDWKKLDVTAAAPGYGAARVRPAGGDGSEVELRLVPDDVPIRGRVLDLQGRPVAGVTVKVQAIEDPPAGDLDSQLEFGLVGRDRYLSGLDSAWHIKEGADWTRKTIRTGSDGRFRVDGAGRDRLVFLELEGPGIGKASLCAMTRVAPPPVPAAPGAGRPGLSLAERPAVWLGLRLCGHPKPDDRGGSPGQGYRPTAGRSPRRRLRRGEPVVAGACEHRSGRTVPPGGPAQGRVVQGLRPRPGPRLSYLLPRRTSATPRDSCRSR